MYEMNYDQQPRRNANVGNTNSDNPGSTQAGVGQIQVEADPAGTPHSDPPAESNKEQRMIGDFDGSSKPLWALNKTVAKSHDSARINILESNMGGVIMFVSPYSTCVSVVVLMCGPIIGRFIFECRHKLLDQ